MFLHIQDNGILYPCELFKSSIIKVKHQETVELEVDIVGMRSKSTLLDPIFRSIAIWNPFDH